MKTIRLNYKKNPGLSLVILGLVIWILPFILVAIDSLIGTTKTVDPVISGAGLFVITVGPMLTIIGLLHIVSKFAFRLLNRK